VVARSVGFVPDVRTNKNTTAVAFSPTHKKASGNNKQNKQQTATTNSTTSRWPEIKERDVEVDTPLGIDKKECICACRDKRGRRRSVVEMRDPFCCERTMKRRAKVEVPEFREG
jgi:hypothetical protein